jgi:hypothetical protein
MKILASYQVILLLGIFFLPSIFTASCDTFAKRCKVTLGQVFQDNHKPVKLLNQSQYFVYFEVSSFFSQFLRIYSDSSFLRSLLIHQQLILILQSYMEL